jgi:hypothetical protein
VSRRPFLLGGLATVIGIVAFVWIDRPSVPSVPPVLTSLWSRATASRLAPQAGDAASVTDPLSDPGKSLRDVYEANERSLDPAERSMAWHAWSVCVPNYVSEQGQAAPESQWAEGLPNDASRPARLSARRQLAERCADFAHESRDRWLQAAAANVERHRAGDLRSRGELAMESVQAGNDDEAVRLIREIVERRSPYELHDLSGLVTRWHRGAPKPTDELRDAVLAVVGCDLGMDCGANSLPALELCAYGGTCEGDFAERALVAFPDIDRAQLNVLRVETAKAIRDGLFNPTDFFAPPESSDRR